MQRFYRPGSFNRRKPVVEDLREKLNRKRQEKELDPEVSTKNLPPPDPAYNFLKDPLRGDACENANSPNEKKMGNKNRNAIKSEVRFENKSDDGNEKNPSKLIEKSPQANRKVSFQQRRGPPSYQANRNKNFDERRAPPREWQKQNWKSPASQEEVQHTNFKEAAVRPLPKQLPVHNIKVEVSSSSGERKCTFDETKTVEIPVVAKKDNYMVKPTSGKWSQKRGPQKYYSVKKTQKSSVSPLGENTEEKKDVAGEVIETNVASRNGGQSVIANGSGDKVDSDAIQKNQNQSAHGNKLDINQNDEQVMTESKNDKKVETITETETVKVTEIDKVTDASLETVTMNKNENQVVTANKDDKTETDTMNQNKTLLVTANKVDKAETDTINKNENQPLST